MQAIDKVRDEMAKDKSGQIVLAVVGLTVAATMAAVVAAIVWGWWRG